jgi:ABC-type multidrug transport system fused ATPase/permease subunit
MSTRTATRASTIALEDHPRPTGRFGTLFATIALLYRVNPRAFLVSAVASLGEPLFFPALLLALHTALAGVSVTDQGVQVTPAVALAGFGIAVLLLVQRLAVIVRDTSSTLLRQESWVVVSKAIMAKLPQVPYPLFENNQFQARYGLVIREASLRSATLVDMLLTTVPIFFGLVGLAVTLLVLAPLLVIAILAIAIPAGLIERRFSEAMYRLEEDAAPAKLRMEALTNMQVDAPWQRDVRVYHSDVIAREHAALAEGYFTELKRLNVRFLGLRGFAATIQAVGLALALAAAYELLTHGQLSLVNIVVLIPGLSFLFGMVQTLIYHIRELLEGLRYASALFEFLSTEHFDEMGKDQTPGAQEDDVANQEVQAQQMPPALEAIVHLVTSDSEGEDAIAMVTRLRAIRLSSVSYIYPETGTQALVGLTCELQPGLTAVVGTNGAGKSTLVKLLSGLMLPTSGHLEAIRETGEAAPLEACAKAILFQDPAHFRFSIRHNVTMRQTSVDGEEARIRHALRLAGLLEVVERLPDGIDTVVGAGFGGVADLSGGQWQRLSLARLLYHDAPLLVLDEPSASLDPVGERQIFALLAALGKEKIIVFTTHRYDTVRRADRIAVLVDGRLAELGTHEELERNAGDFYALYLAQDVPIPAD